MEMIKTQDLAFTYPGTEDQVNTRALRGVDVTICLLYTSDAADD